jgi:hypothetical protein
VNVIRIFLQQDNYSVLNFILATRNFQMKFTITKWKFPNKL